MTKSELVKAISEEAKSSIKDAQAFVDAFICVTGKALADGDNVAIVGFGTFEVSSRKARTARNFSTGATINVPASKAVKFKVGKNLKEAVNFS